MYVSLSVSLSVCWYVCMYVCMSICLSVCLSVHPYVCTIHIFSTLKSIINTTKQLYCPNRTKSLPNCMSVCQSVCLSVCLSVGMYVCMCVHPSVCLSVHPYVCLSVCMYVCMSIRLSFLGQGTNVQLPLSGVVLSKQYLTRALRALVPCITKKMYVHPSVCLSICLSVCMYVSMYVCMWLNWLECAFGDWEHPGPLGQSSSAGGPHT